MLKLFHSPEEAAVAEKQKKKKRQRRIPGSYSKWKQYCTDVKEAIAVVGRQPVCVKRYLTAKGIQIPSSTINYYVNKFISCEEDSKFSFF
ncbi:22K [Turkey adenovirus 3]|uniref:22K n=1 Tax=Turkey adenovirus 3 TaxID=41678 RepID=A0A7G9ULD9_9ADEN|nr:22K [Turkey siadenovirus A]AAX51184.1 22K [Avirulent turkey hemorrhagic enteritis virus]QNN94725.1 22K [Turkey adenovirus 3]QNN94748.1 22K [Turkey adenovirus 3]QNN94775.1 22K [Turkey adenovirus 3]QNN94798.1 22K [Turkey adenovirus 3]